MNIRSITADDIFKFEQIGYVEGKRGKLDLETWLAQGRTELRLCFIAEESNQFLARIIYGISDDNPDELILWQLKSCLNVQNHMSINEILLKESLETLKHQGFTNVEYHLHSHVVEDVDGYEAMFLHQNFTLSQKKLTFETLKSRETEPNPTLTFKTLEQVGEDLFIEAIEHVTKDTLDQDDLEQIALVGSKHAATSLFNLLKEIDDNPSWWQLCFSADNRLVGLVVPQRFSETRGAINYIGVTPEHRGQGYSSNLIEHATQRLFNEGVQQVVADFDVHNTPLKNAFLTQGYSMKGTLSILKKQLV